MKLSNHIHYLGVNDRKKHLFENNWPLPNGISYNSYLISDVHSALIDTLEYGSHPKYLQKITQILDGKPLDYIIVNHVEPDHAGMIAEILRYYPQSKVVGNNRTHKLLRSYFGFSDNLLEVNDCSEVDLGSHKLEFVMTPWVHWPETMMTYDTVSQTLFSCDAFGSFGALDGGIFDDEIDFDRFYLDEMLRYYSNIVGKYSLMVQKAFSKLAGIPLKTICPSHGPLWRTNPMKVVGLYDKWSKHKADEGVVVVFASMYGHAEELADIIARKIAERGLKQIRIYDVSKTHSSYILRDIWRYKGVILGSCAYNNGMHPMMLHLCNELEVSAPKDKIFSLFGSCGWNGGGIKSLQSFVATTGWEEATSPVEIMGALDAEKELLCDSLAQEMVTKIFSHSDD